MASTINITSRPVGPVGYGLMSLTWSAKPQPAEESFTSMNTALEYGANFFNGGEIYGTPERNSSHLLAEYFAKYPETADKVVLSVKGGTRPGTLVPDGSPVNIRRSVEDSSAPLRGVKVIDIFQPARADPKVPVEEVIATLAELVKEGKIRGIGLSEVRAETIERAHKVHPIAAVEMELSLWTTDVLHNGVAETCARLGIPLVAYSPLGRGGLAGDIVRRTADFPEDDVRRRFPRYQDAALEVNNRLSEELDVVAKKKDVTRAQLAIGWVKALSGRTITTKDGDSITLGTIIPIPGTKKSERVAENCKPADLTDDDMEQIAEILKRNPIVGDRYHEHGMTYLNG